MPQDALLGCGVAAFCQSARLLVTMPPNLGSSSLSTLKRPT